MTSGRTTSLDTIVDFPEGEKWLRKQKVMFSPGNAKQKRIALEQLDEYIVDEFELEDESSSFSLNDLDNTILEDYSIWLDDDAGLAHSTLAKRWRSARKYLNAHVDENLGHTDNESYILNWLDEGSETSKQNDRDIHWLPQDKIEQLIDGAKNLKNRLVISLLWHTGCRPSEVARMKVRRVNRSTRSINVQTSKVDSDAKNSERTVFWGLTMEGMMREWLDLGGRKQYVHAAESPYLIVGYNTPSIGPRQINTIVRRAAENAGIQETTIKRADGTDVNRVTPKTLRHSFAVHSVRGREKSGTPSMDLERLRRLMGHSSLETTRQYLQYRTSDIRDAYDISHPG